MARWPSGPRGWSQPSRVAAVREAVSHAELIAKWVRATGRCRSFSGTDAVLDPGVHSAGGVDAGVLGAPAAGGLGHVGDPEAVAPAVRFPQTVTAGRRGGRSRRANDRRSPAGCRRRSRSAPATRWVRGRPARTAQADRPAPRNRLSVHAPDRRKTQRSLLRRRRRSQVPNLVHLLQSSRERIRTSVKGTKDPRPAWLDDPGSRPVANFTGR